MPQQYHIAHRRQILRDFDRTIKHIWGVFVTRYGDAQTDAMVREARLEHDRLIADLPYIGGKQPFTRFIIAAAWFLAMYRVLKSHGRTPWEWGAGCV